MKYLYALSLLVALTSATGVLIPCVKNCAKEAQDCTAQAGVKPLTCVHNTTNCVLQCQLQMYPTSTHQTTGCTITAMDNLNEGMSLNDIERNMTECIEGKNK